VASTRPVPFDEERGAVAETGIGGATMGLVLVMLVVMALALVVSGWRKRGDR